MTKTVVITPSTADLPQGWSADRFREALQDAAVAWSYPGVPCSVQLVVGPPQSEWRAERDGTNLVAFRSRSWCHNGRCGQTSTFPLRAMAMTTPYPGPSGTPEEADVELNAVAFRLTGSAEGGSQADGRGALDATPTWSAPLEPVLVHELGHVLGLPDVCGQRRASGRPVTSGCSAEDRQRVMFAAGHNVRPTRADVAELCRLYPPDGSSAIESVPVGPAMAPRVGVGPELLITALVMGLVLAVGRRVRRSAFALWATRPD